MPRDRRPVVSMSSSLTPAALVLAAATAASAFAPCPTPSSVANSLRWSPASIRAGGALSPRLPSLATRHLRAASIAMAILSDDPLFHQPPTAHSPPRTNYAGAADNSERELAVLTHNPLELRRRLGIAVEEQRFDDAALLKKLLDASERSDAELVAAVAREDYAAASKAFGDALCNEVTRSAERAPRFDVGLVVEHRTLGIRGVIFAADEECAADEEWVLDEGVEMLARGRRQPFYSVLIDTRDQPSPTAAYLPEESLIPSPSPSPIHHPLLPKLFAPNPESRASRRQWSYHSSPEAEASSPGPLLAPRFAGTTGPPQDRMGPPPESHSSPEAGLSEIPEAGLSFSGMGPPQDTTGPPRVITGPPQDHARGPPQDCRMGPPRDRLRTGPPRDLRTGPPQDCRTGPLQGRGRGVGEEEGGWLRDKEERAMGEEGVREVWYRPSEALEGLLETLAATRRAKRGR